MLSEITKQARNIASELVERARLEKGDIFVVGCSTSEIQGAKLGTQSDIDIAMAVLEGIYPVLKEKGIYLAAQCCEHLDRAIVLEKECAERYRLRIVNAVPQPKAGGSFPSALYTALEKPCLVSQIEANAGMDIGCVLIGMNLRRTAVPVRTKTDKIGQARVICARTRPMFVGGARAFYDEELL